MSEEIKIEPRIICVCAKCGTHSSKTSVEFNFRDQKVYQICPECNHQNSMSILPPAVAKPYPKTRVQR